MDLAQLAISVRSDDAQTAGQRLDGMARASRQAERGVQSLDRRSSGLGGTLGNVQRQAMAVAAALGLAFSTGSAINGALEISRATGELSTLLPGASDRLDAMTAAANRFGVTFGTGERSQLAAFYAAVSAGATDATQAIERVDAANRLAIGGAASLDGSIAILNTATNAYAAQALSAADASDVLFTGVRAGVTTIEELSGSLGRVIPTASSMGIGFDELVASVAALTTQGQDTALAVTGISGALTQILRPSAQAQQLAQELGLEFNATGLRARGFAGFMQEVVRATGGSEEAMATLFGSVEALRAVLSLAGEGGVRFAEIMEMMENRAEASQTAYERMAQEFDQRWNRVTAFATQQAVRFGNALLGVLIPAAEEVIKVFTRADDRSRALEVVLTALGVVAGVTLVNHVVALTTALAAKTAAFVTAIPAVRAYAMSVALVGPASATASAAVTALGVAVRFALGPVGVIITALGLLTLAWQENGRSAEITRQAYDRARGGLQDLTSAQYEATEAGVELLRSDIARVSALREESRSAYEAAAATLELARARVRAAQAGGSREGAIEYRRQAREIEYDLAAIRGALQGHSKNVTDLETNLQSLLAQIEARGQANRQSRRDTANAERLERDRAFHEMLLNAESAVAASRQMIAEQEAAKLKEMALERERTQMEAAQALEFLAWQMAETALERMEMEHLRRMEILREARNAELLTEQEFLERRNAMQADYDAARNRIMLASAANGFGSLAEIVGAAAGETSAAYTALFAISKGFAIAESVIAMQQAIAKALAMGFPQNIPLMAQAAASGAQIISTIQSTQPGFQSGTSWTGSGPVNGIAGVVHNREAVLNAPARAGVGGAAVDYMNRYHRLPPSDSGKGGNTVYIDARGATVDAVEGIKRAMAELQYRVEEVDRSVPARVISTLVDNRELSGRFVD